MNNDTNTTPAVVSAGEKHRWAYIGGAFALVIFALVVASCIARRSRTTKRPVRPARPVRPSRDGVEFDLSDLSGARDLELGVVCPDPARLPDPDMFVIPEDDVGGKSNAADANSGKRGRQAVKHGVLERPVMSGAVLIHGDEDEETVLIPAGAPMGNNSKRESKGKGKAREVDDDESYSSSEPFGLSRYLSPRSGFRAPNSVSAPLAFDSALPAMPKPAMTRESCGRSVSRCTVYTGSSTIPGPSRMPYPSRFVVVDTDVSSEEEDAQRWKPAPPKVSRYRGLSATRRSQKPRAPSPEDAAPQRLAESAPLPAPETFYFGSKRDSWEIFASDSEADTYNSDERTSEVFSTVTGVQPAETTFQTNTDSDSNNNNNNNNNNNSVTETETGKDASGSSGEQYPVWEHGGPFVPDSRILEQKASLAGRKAKFVEVDVDGSTIEAPGETSDVFRDCLKLLREGARSPTILTSFGYDEQEKVRPGMAARGKTWGMSGALFKRRYDQDGDVGEGPSRPQAAARSKTAQVKSSSRGF